jgi:FixJ family two-component response regulator
MMNAPNSTIQVYLVDDDEAVVSALSLLLETVGMNVTAFLEPTVFLRQFPNLSPGCLVIDIRMPQISGLKLQGHMLSAGCDWPIIVISGHGDIEACRKAFQNGAIDFLSKPIDEQDLIDAVQKGHLQLKRMQAKAAEKEEAIVLLKQLTAREREVLDMITRGFVTREIASSLDVSPRTVESHRAHIVSKFRTNSVVEMAQILTDGGDYP